MMAINQFPVFPSPNQAAARKSPPIWPIIILYLYHRRLIEQHQLSGAMAVDASRRQPSDARERLTAAACSRARACVAVFGTWLGSGGIVAVAGKRQQVAGERRTASGERRERSLSTTLYAAAADN